jgi:hypothetical protein
MLPAPLEESGTTPRFLRARDRLGAGLLVGVCALALAACGGGERQDEDEPEGEFPVEITGAEFPAKQRLAQTSDLVLTVQNTGDEAIPDLAVTIFTEGNPDAEGADGEEAEPEDETGTTTGPTNEPSDSETDPAGEEDLGAEVDQALQEEVQQELDEQSAEEGTAEGADAGDGTSTAGEEGGEADAAAPGGASSQADGAFSVRSEQADLAIPSRPVWILEQGFPRLADTEIAEPPEGELSGGSGAEAVQTNTFSFGELEPGESFQMIWQVTPVQAGTYTIQYRLAAGLQGKAEAVTADGSVPEGEFVVQISDVPPQTRVDDDGKVVPIKPSDIIGQAGTQEQKGELDSDTAP